MAKLLKELYNKEYIETLSTNISLHYPLFKKDEFINIVLDNEWKNRELKQRMRHISTSLYGFLPQDYKESIDILKLAFLEMNSEYMLENMIFQDFVEVFGMDDFQTSIEALECFTVGSSSEFAIRQFILKYPKETMVRMKIWATSENHHIRRLSSEGCRPRLPWAVALQEFKKDPQEILQILEILKDDDSLYVRKSVANSINDISKDNPDIVIDLAKRWIDKNSNRDWIVKHGCRTLLKNGDLEILKIFGFIQREDIMLNRFIVSNSVDLGKNLEFSFTLKSNQNLGNLRIEYKIDFLRLRDRYNSKVFKIAESNYKQKSKEFSKRCSFKEISTRKYYRGKHFISIVVNGVVMDTKEFYLRQGTTV